jgi:hypothetical protein
MTEPNPNDKALEELIQANSELFGLAEAVSAASASEAREFPRYAFRGRAKAVILAAPDQPGSEPDECEVLTTDLSRGGLSLLLKKQLKPGQQLVLVLNDSNCLVEVCWSCRVWGGLYSAGCRFLGTPPTGVTSKW